MHEAVAQLYPSCMSTLSGQRMRPDGISINGKIMEKTGPGTVITNGCNLDVKDNHGRPMKKPWKIASTHAGSLKTLSRHACDGEHDHATCMGGVNAPDSAFYPMKFAWSLNRGQQKTKRG